MFFTVETMRLGGAWPQVTNFALKDNLIILYIILILVTRGYSRKFLLDSNFSNYNYCTA